MILFKYILQKNNKVVFFTFPVLKGFFFLIKKEGFGATKWPLHFLNTFTVY